MIFLIALFVGVICAIVMFFVINLYTNASQPMEMRLKIVENFFQQDSSGTLVVEKEPVKSFAERILVPLGKAFETHFKGLTPENLTKTVEKRLMMAGGIAGLTAQQFIAVNGLMTVVAVGCSLLFAIILKAGMGKLLVFVFYGLMLGLFFPNFIVSRQIAARQARIQKDLPDVLDLVTVSVEAGLSFDGALGKLAEKMKGTLVDEFTRVLQEMRMGVTRRDSLKAMSARCGNKELALFVTALVQADQLGVGIGSVLRVQAVAIRKNRQQQIEQKAQKAPIQMLFPLVACIFPSLFIVILGPAAIKITEQFAK